MDLKGEEKFLLSKIEYEKNNIIEFRRNKNITYIINGY